MVAVSPQLRLVEDNPASLSLLDICKQMCAKKNVQYDEPLTKYYDRLAFIQVFLSEIFLTFVCKLDQLLTEYFSIALSGSWR